MKKFLLLSSFLAASFASFAPSVEAKIKPLSATCNAKCHCLLRSTLNSWKPASNGHGYSCWNSVDGELFSLPGGDANGDGTRMSATQVEKSEAMRAPPAACPAGQKPPCNDFGVPKVPQSAR